MVPEPLASLPPVLPARQLTLACLSGSVQTAMVNLRLASASQEMVEAALMEQVAPLGEVMAKADMLVLKVTN